MGTFLNKKYTYYTYVCSRYCILNVSRHMNIQLLFRLVSLIHKSWTNSRIAQNSRNCECVYIYILPRGYWRLDNSILPNPEIHGQRWLKERNAYAVTQSKTTSTSVAPIFLWPQNNVSFIQTIQFKDWLILNRRKHQMTSWLRKNKRIAAA